MYYYQRLRDLREDKDKSQEEIGKILGVSQTQYSRWERAAQEIPLHHAIKLADYYNVSLDYLTGRVQHKRHWRE